MALSHFLRCFVRVVRWIPVLFIMATVCGSYYGFVVKLCIFTVTSTIEKAVYVVIYHLLFIMFLWSYLRTIYSSPASPSEKFCLSKSDKEQYLKEDRPEIKQEILERAAKDFPIFTRTENNDIRYCDHCQLMKPDRCHHCSTCGKCVLKKDHHCPWTNNCIGFSNYKFFLLFLMYGCLYCLFICATTLQYVLKFWTDNTDNTENQLSTMLYMSAIFLIALMILFSCHCWLIIKNQSTLEAFQDPPLQGVGGKDRYSLGFRKNVKEVFGEQKLYWLFPVFTSPGDGCSFPTRVVSGDPEQNAGINQSDIAKQYLRLSLPDLSVNPRTSSREVRLDELGRKVKQRMEPPPCGFVDIMCLEREDHSFICFEAYQNTQASFHHRQNPNAVH